jgi:hypothetical protein
VQRFGGSLNLNVHFHDVFLDGVFTRDEHDHLCFHPLPPPDRDELDAIVRRIHMRAIAWLTRHDYLDEQREHGLEPGAIEACATIAMQRGSFTRLADNGPTPIAPEEPKLLRLSLPTTAPILARARDPTELTWSEGEHEQLGA